MPFELLLQVLLIVYAVLFPLWAWVVFSAYRLLRYIRPANRYVQPLFVWANLIPLLNLVVAPYTFVLIGRSLRAEFGTCGLTATNSLAFGEGPTLLVLVMLLIPACFPLSALLLLTFLWAYSVELGEHRKALAAFHDGTSPWWEDEASE